MQLKVNSKISTLALCVSVLLGNSGQALADNDSSELSTGSAPVAKSIQLSDPLHAGDSVTLSVDDIAQDPDGDTLYIDQVEVADDAGSVESQGGKRIVKKVKEWRKGGRAEERRGWSVSRGRRRNKNTWRGRHSGTVRLRRRGVSVLLFNPLLFLFPSSFIPLLSPLP